jgi:hypothetical protein
MAGYVVMRRPGRGDLARWRAERDLSADSLAVTPSVVPIASAAEQQQENDDQQDEAEPTAIMAAAIVSGAIAIIPSATKQQHDDQDQQNKAHIKCPFSIDPAEFGNEKGDDVAQ